MKYVYTSLTFFLISLIVLLGCELTSSQQTTLSDARVFVQVEDGPQSSILNGLSDQENEIALTEVKFFVKEFELEGTRKTSGFEVENFIVNLPLDGSPFPFTEKKIPAGFYDEFELEIEKPGKKEFGNDFDFRDETGSYSVVVKGLFNGEEFVFRSREDFEIEADLKPPLEISEDENSVLMIRVDVSNWFVGHNGEILTPNDFRNSKQINRNIKKSFNVAKDNW